MPIPTDMAIIDAPQVPAVRLTAYLLGRTVRPTPSECERIAATYTVYGELSGIGNLIPFAQAVHETAGFTSPRWVQSRNPAGLGATNDGAWGSNFVTIAEGVIAQYAHLLAYAARDEALSVPQRLLVAFDPRLEALERSWGRGSAPRWIDLNGKWAVPGRTYGQRILKLATQISG